MKPYFETSMGKLYHGDCLEILPEVDYDVIVTDPVWPNCPKDLLPGSNDPQKLFNDCMSIINVERIIIVMRFDSDPRFLARIKLDFFRTIQLPYVIPGYIGRKLGGDEIAYWFGTPIKYADGRKVIPGRAPAAQPSDRPPNGHPCSRSQKHFNWLVYWVSDSDELICDPFAGSGTTAIACEKNKRNWIGIEIDEHYCEIAASRIEFHSKQLSIEIPEA